MPRKLLFTVLIILLLSPVWARNFSEYVKSFSLSNGMRFLVYERPGIPTFAGLIMAQVGSVDERNGETGLAHFFEHLAFKGTPVMGTRDFEKEKAILDKMDVIGDQLSAEYLKGKDADQGKITAFNEQLKEMQKETLQYVVKDELDKIYSENGGDFLNASTSNDSTQYFVMLPSNRLELWFLIESERFKYPVLREFYSERNVIAEERRMFEDNNPTGAVMEEFYNLAFTIHPYRHSVVGYMEDIQSYTTSKALNFYRTFYIPNNLVATIVGEVKFEEVKRLAEVYFGDIPRGPEPPRPLFIEPKQKGERRTKVLFDAQPRLFIGYHMPGYRERGNLVLEVISMILSQGETSRFQTDLVNQKMLALTAYAYENSLGVRYPSLFQVYALPRHPHTTAELETAIYQHLERLKTEPVKAQELTKVINQAEASLNRSIGFAENVFLAMRIARNVLLYDDLDNEAKRVEAMKTVTPQEIMDTAQQIFTEENRTVAVQEKKAEGGK